MVLSKHLRLPVRPQKDSFPHRKSSLAILSGSVIPTVSNRGRPVVVLHGVALTRPRVKGNFVESKDTAASLSRNVSRKGRQ